MDRYLRMPLSVPKRSTSYATDDYTMEWPQSGERLRGRQKMKEFQEANAGSRPPGDCAACW
jgi:hypothetical protein